MFTLSAFADEISPNPDEQIAVLQQCGIRHIELRSILKTNVLDLTDLQVAELKLLLDRRRRGPGEAARAGIQARVRRRHGRPPS